MTEFQPMPEQPPKSFCYGDVAPITNGKLWAIGRSRWHPEGAAAWPPDPMPGFTAPVTIGERRAVREDRWYRDSDGITVYDDGQFRLHPSSILGAKLVTPVNDEWWQEDRNRMPEFGFVRQPACTMPDWAVRRYQRCVSCVPVQRDGVWGWLITWEDE